MAKSGVPGWLIGLGVGAVAALIGAVAATNNTKLEAALGRSIDELIKLLNSEKGKRWGTTALSILQAELAKRLPFPLGLLLDIVWQVEQQSVGGQLQNTHKRSSAIAMAKARNIRV